MLVKSISKPSILRDFATYCYHPRMDAGTQYTTQAKADYDTIEGVSIVSKTDFSRKSVTDGIVEEAVIYILHKDTITLVSLWNIDYV